MTLSIIVGERVILYNMHDACIRWAYDAEMEARYTVQLRRVEQELQTARNVSEVARQRMEAAELAKIQVSMRLAEMDDARAAQIANASANESGSPHASDASNVDQVCSSPTEYLETWSQKNTWPSPKNHAHNMRCWQTLQVVWHATMSQFNIAAVWDGDSSS